MKMITIRKYKRRLGVSLIISHRTKGKKQGQLSMQFALNYISGWHDNNHPTLAYDPACACCFSGYSYYSTKLSLGRGEYTGTWVFMFL